MYLKGKRIYNDCIYRVCNKIEIPVPNFGTGKGRKMFIENNEIIIEDREDAMILKKMVSQFMKDNDLNERIFDELTDIKNELHLLYMMY